MATRMEQHELDISREYGGPTIGAWPRMKGQRIRPHGGGGGGDGGAQKREDERQARVQAATDTINAIFGVGNPANSREPLYAQQRNVVYDLNKIDVDRQAGEAERLNRFALARAGQLGGSLNIDSNAEINRRTNEGLMRAGAIADGASADLRAQDEQTRSNLISLAQSGIDTGTAASMALEGQKANAANAAGARGGATVGSLFNDMAGAYLTNQQMQGMRAGSSGNSGQQWFGVSDTRSSYGGR